MDALPAIFLLALLAAYALLGVAFAAFFVLRGVNDLDPVAKASRWPFRIMIFPGAAGLWPVMLIKWLNSRRGRPVTTENGQLPPHH